MPLDFIQNYDGFTNDDVRELLDANEFSHDELDEMLAHEQATKDREGAVDALETELDELTPVPSDDDGDGDVDPDASASDAPDEVVVTTSTDVNRRYVGGVWFNDLDARKTVAYSGRVEAAVEDGVLDIVGTPDDE